MIRAAVLAGAASAVGDRHPPELTARKRREPHDRPDPGRSRIVECLGEGGMGTVYRAHDPRLERDVAIKVLKQDALHDEDSKRRFRLEARALSRLLHPNIATLFDFDSEDGIDFLRARIRGRRVAGALSLGPDRFPRRARGRSLSRSRRPWSRPTSRASSIAT